MKAFSTADIFHFRQLSAVTGEAGLPWLVFGVKQAREHSDDYEQTLWGFVPSTGDQVRQLTSSISSASSPVLSPDGTSLAFLSSRDNDGLQVHILPLQGGEARKLSANPKYTLSTLEQWSPRSDRLLVCAKVDWQEDGEEAPDANKRGPAVARYLPYKQDGVGITTGTRTHLFGVDITSGKMEPLTKGDFDVTFGAWSPDGKTLAYVRHRGGRERHRTDLWFANADGSEARLTVDAFASIVSLRWSPDSQRIVLAASEVEGDSSVGLWLLANEGRDRTRLGGTDFELSSAGVALWHPDGQRAAAIGETQGLHRLAVIDVDANDLQVHDQGLRSVEGLAQCGDRLYFIGTSQSEFDEIHSVTWNGGDLQVHSQFNAWVQEREAPRVSLRSFRVPDGDGGTEEIHAWVLLPAEGAGHGEGPYPLLVDMHGGPHSTALVDFSAHTYWYLLLSKGWAVVAPNAVGSTSYGRTFATRLRGRWGELDLPQYEAVVRCMQDEGLADTRLACAGKSYGGFLSAWAIGHSDLFRAAAVAAPVSNIQSHMGTSDSGYYVTPYAMDADAEDAPDRYRDLSPVTECHKARAATLILQGENDGRCPRGQAEELFAHLIHCNDVPVELVVYPGSSHAEAESGRPSNRVDYHDRIVQWFATHVTHSQKASD